MLWADLNFSHLKIKKAGEQILNAMQLPWNTVEEKLFGRIVNVQNVTVSPHALLSTEEVFHQDSTLQAYFQNEFPQVDFAQFETWSEEVFKIYTLMFHDRLGFLRKHKFFRKRLIGLHSAFIVANSNEQTQLRLSSFSSLDPIELRKFSGLQIPLNLQ